MSKPRAQSNPKAWRESSERAQVLEGMSDAEKSADFMFSFVLWD